ncbi:J domain-containing protein [Bdellovibrio sp. 22V]|uniref:J domain-containing protein n=1 Tax=Bdellovibrio sp. 22V TaxID=3044166 RepID=UPI00254281F1|nr:J domain-containing protein [Bdellovibrio sp. 22V]WII71956.1 J domain-containing protein [Bdellovibrio sp. 22V]
MKHLILLITLFSLPVKAQTADEVRRIMNSQSNYYQVLGVDKNASSDEIRAAYRRLMKVYHPDRYLNEPQKLHAATEVMKKLNITRDTLMDPIARQKYDKTVKVNTQTNTGSKTAPNASAKPNNPSTKKWTPPDFTAEAEAKAQAEADARAKAEAQAQAKAETAKEPPRPAPDTYEKPKPNFTNNDSFKTEAPKAESSKAAVESPRTEAAPRTTEKPKGPVDFRAQQAAKFYEDTARCGDGFFKSFIDVML